MSDTIQGLLVQAADQLVSCSPTAQLDAEVLLAHCLGKQRSYLRAWPERQIDPTQKQCFAELIDQRQRGMPVAYLTGQREFWSRAFEVNSAVLIPRPDSELLIELCLQRVSCDLPIRIADLGTGSGILAITLALELPLASVTACDFSAAALEVARNNAVLHKARVSFVHSDWLKGVNGAFDLIISNPPYIADDDPHLQQGDLRFEPQSALVSNDTGLADWREIADQARSALNSGGCLMMEHGFQQAEAAQQILRQLNYQSIFTKTDLSGNPRVTGGIWNPL